MSPGKKKSIFLFHERASAFNPEAIPFNPVMPCCTPLAGLAQYTGSGFIFHLSILKKNIYIRVPLAWYLHP